MYYVMPSLLDYFRIAADADLCTAEACEQIKIVFSHP